jgi:molecular chaperone GrpE (heat shock protein)
MWHWLHGWLAKADSGEQRLSDERLLALERQVQSLRLELTEQHQIVANLKSELQHQRDAEDARLADAVRAQMERLMTHMATPVAHLLTQAHLLERDDKPIQARDVLGVARCLVRTLEDNGLTLEGKVGETLPFDPNRHEPLSAEATLQPGETVVVKFVGAFYGGTVCKKAGVARA